MPPDLHAALRSATAAAAHLRTLLADLAAAVEANDAAAIVQCARALVAGALALPALRDSPDRPTNHHGSDAGESP